MNTKLNVGERVYYIIGRSPDPKKCPTCHQSVYSHDDPVQKVKNGIITGIVAYIGWKTNKFDPAKNETLYQVDDDFYIPHTEEDLYITEQDALDRLKEQKAEYEAMNREE